MRKNNVKTLMKGIGTIALMLCLCMSFSFFSLGAEDDFETEIAAFPESYKPYLRELHKSYPNWEFEAYETGLDFEEVVDNEMGRRSLISSSQTSDYLKSRMINFFDPATLKYEDFYNYSTGNYIQKDGGFVGANRLAVAYYIDPRNFLNEEYIFQFENLHFTDSMTVESVEAVLQGTYMHKAPMNYLDTTGKEVKVSKTYGQAIFDAGKKYNINPCYIASKIRNEVGADGSGSSLGYYKCNDGTVIRGIYNLYNIGAYDGGDAIQKGLVWAKGSGSYGRPWTSPEKSIDGGAKFLSDDYIAVGQFTGYLQRFNVSKGSDNDLYTHQYMTNITGALSQGYFNYVSYVKMNIIQNKICFSIPVYENMPEISFSERAFNGDSAVQYGYISAKFSNVRTGPSTNNAKVVTKAGESFTLPNGYSVKIIGKVPTDNSYYVSVMQYPFWYNISFTYQSDTYEGYVPADFVTISDVTRVGTGEYELPYMEGGNLELYAISQDENIAKVTEKGKVSFLKTGKVEILSYNSSGMFDVVAYDVVSDPPVTGSLSSEPYQKKIAFTLGETVGAKAYQFTLFDGDGNMIKTVQSSSANCEFTGLDPAVRYYCFARPVMADGVYGRSVENTVITAPAKPSSIKYAISEDGVKFSWKAVSGASGYYIYGYDSDSGKYKSLGKSETNYITVPVNKMIYDHYCLRAFAKDSIGHTFSIYSGKVTVDSLLGVPNGFEVTDVTEKGYTLSWEKAFGATGYKVYMYDSVKDSYVLLADTVETLITVNGKAAGKTDKYKILSYNSDKESAFSGVLTISTLPAGTASFVAVDITGTSAVLNWNKVSGAISYRIYDESKNLLAETDGLSLKVENLEEFEEYTYTVVACVDNLGTVFESVSKKLTFYTALNTAKNLTCSKKAFDGFTVTWDENPKANEYHLYLYDEENKLIAEDQTENNSYTFASLEGNKSYSVSIRCAANKGGETVYSEYSLKLTVKTGATAPTGINSKSVTSKGYTITWKSDPEAYSYLLYKKSGSNYKKIAEVKGTSYKVSGLTEGTTDSYKLSTKVKSGSKYYESPLSAAFSASTKLGKVTGVKESVSVTTATVSWKAVKGADCYKVYLYEDGKYVCKATITGTSYKFKSLTPGATHKYAVKAYAKPSTGAVSGSYVYGDFLTKPSKVSKVKVSSVEALSHTLSWSKSEGANFYYVYRYDTAKKEYTEVGGTSGTKYKVSNLVSGTTYKYKVVSAVLSAGECLITGTASDVYSFTTAPVKVKSLKVKSATTNKIKITWAKCDGASGYEVCYYDADIGTYLTAGTTTSNSFKMTDLSSGRSLKLKVRAYRTLDGKNYYGVYSSALTAKTK